MRAHAGCVGIAAPQIGEPVRLAVVDVFGHPRAGTSNGLLVLADSRITEVAGRRLGREGCLSLPEVTADVWRAERIVVAGRFGRAWCDGFEARAV